MEKLPPSLMHDYAIVPSSGGYSIPIKHNISAETQFVLITCHGFGSSKNNSTAAALSYELAPYNAAVVAFDWPAHGASFVDGHKLTVERCLEDLATVEKFVRRSCPHAEIGYIGSSFGAYNLVLYLALYPHKGRRAVLRCAAVTMPQLLHNDITPDQARELEEQGEFTLPYDPPLIITQKFLDDLNTHDASILCHESMGQLLLIHGTADEEVPVEDVRRFSAQFNIPLVEIAGAGHTFDEPGATEQVIRRTVEFLMREPDESPWIKRY